MCVCLERKIKHAETSSSTHTNRRACKIDADDDDEFRLLHTKQSDVLIFRL